MSTEYYECKRLSWDFKKKLSEKYFFQKHFGKILFSKIFWKNIFFKNIFQKYFFQKYFSKIFFWKKYLFRNFLKKGGGGGVIQPNWGSGLNEDLVNISSLHNVYFKSVINQPPPAHLWNPQGEGWGWGWSWLFSLFFTPWWSTPFPGGGTVNDRFEPHIRGWSFLIFNLGWGGAKLNFVKFLGGAKMNFGKFRVFREISAIFSGWGGRAGAIGKKV